MSYKLRLGDIATRYDEYTGAKYIYSLTMIDHSAYDIEYIITVRHEGKPDNEREILSLWSKEAKTLSDLIREA